ncbi:EAL domain-containing protein [Photobacterium makurazakiensis]|uniref:EAL domain-containing protein n=1 Tax=Photobacterium makurazakiensis TaxID=2910234 RepID=UPI003D0F3308
MTHSFWLRWRLPSLLFISGLAIIAISSSMLSNQLFKFDVSKRLDNLHSFYQGRYLELGKELDQLVDQLSFTCNKKDLALLRETIEESTVIQLIELHTKQSRCSIYGDEVSLIKEFNESEAKLLSGNANRSYSVEPYFNHRVKVTFNMPTGQLITITEPFQNIYTDSEMCTGCVAMALEYQGSHIPLYLQHPDKQYTPIASKNFSPQYIITISATPEGIKYIVQKDLLTVQLLLSSLLLSVCLLIGLKRTPERTLQDLITVGLQEKEFIPHYQPIVNTQTNQLEGCEVLMRWHKKNGEHISPEQFIPIAEYSGQITELTYYLLSDITSKFTQASAHQLAGFLSLNVTPALLESHAFADDVLAMVEKSQIPPSSIAFEVTERTPFSNLPLAHEVITRLNEHGISIKLDDAGTGYGGFSYLQALPIDTLKIDKMFIDTIGTNDMKSTILDSIILFAKHAGLKLIAEGVENQAQVDYLQSKGVWIMQGYFFSKPLSFSEILKYNANPTASTEQHISEQQQS